MFRNNKNIKMAAKLTPPLKNPSKKYPSANHQQKRATNCTKAQRNKSSHPTHKPNPNNSQPTNSSNTTPCCNCPRSNSSKTWSTTNSKKNNTNENSWTHCFKETKWSKAKSPHTTKKPSPIDKISKDKNYWICPPVENKRKKSLEMREVNLGWSKPQACASPLSSPKESPVLTFKKTLKY